MSMRLTLSGHGALIFYLIADKLARGTGDDAANKDGEELDQVAGNAEDEIGDRIAAVRETELLYGPDSLLALYGPLLIQVCGRPGQYRVRVSYLNSPRAWNTSKLENKIKF